MISFGIEKKKKLKSENNNLYVGKIMIYNLISIQYSYNIM